MKIFVILLLSISLISCASPQNTETQTILKDSKLQSIYPLALRGELKSVFAILDTIDDSTLSSSEVKQKEKYYTRFINEDERFDYNTSDTSIIRVVDMFHDYWKSHMIDGLHIDKADSMFVESMASYLFKNKYMNEDISRDSIVNDIYRFSNDYLRGKGYFSNAFGKTGNLYDLFLWKKQKTNNYSIKLMEDSVDVRVYLMDDFISTGWSHYTTFGKSYAGGWANRDALFCVVSAYDMDSENFKVSYLTHEGQHFSDYEKYPNLVQKDLEYRAKLVELVKSNNTTIELIHKFLVNAANKPQNAHAFSNYCVIRDLSALVFSKNYVKEKSAWESIDPKVIRAKSKILFNDNTKMLDAIGADIVSDLIK